jgi:hypothetical protein
MNLEEWIQELVGNECLQDGCNVTKWTRKPADYLCDEHTTTTLTVQSEQEAL